MFLKLNEPLIFGRPNILGNTIAVGYVMPDASPIGSGAFSNMYRWTSSVALDPLTTERGSVIQFDASKSNLTYGSSLTNQPNSLRSLVLIRSY